MPKIVVTSNIIQGLVKKGQAVEFSPKRRPDNSWTLEINDELFHTLNNKWIAGESLGDVLLRVMNDNDT